MPRIMMTQVLLPWYNNDGELCYSPMNLQAPGGVCRRKAFNIMRNYYKDEIGITVCKETLRQIWKTRHETMAMTPDNLNNYLTHLAMESCNEEIEDHADIDSQKEVDEGTGE